MCALTELEARLCHLYSSTSKHNKVLLPNMIVLQVVHGYNEYQFYVFE